MKPPKKKNKTKKTFFVHKIEGFLRGSTRTHLVLPMACKALKANLTACRNHASGESEYCHQHNDFTSVLFKQRWLNKHIYCPDGNTFCFFEIFRIKRILAELKSGRVVLTPKDIEKIPATSEYHDIFFLLIINGFAKPEYNAKLTKTAFNHYLRNKMVIPPEQHGNHLFHRLVRQYLIEDTARHLFMFLWSLPSFSRKYPGINDTIVTEVQSLLDSTGAKELSWYSRETLNKLYLRYKEKLGSDHMLTQYMVQRWLLDLKELYVCEKNIQKCKMDYCKEELMMNRWHPSRIEYYHNLGLEVEDM